MPMRMHYHETLLITEKLRLILVKLSVILMKLTM